MARRSRLLALSGIVLAGGMTACGGGSSPATPTRTPTPVPTPTPVAVTPSPTPTPTLNCRPGGDCQGLTTPVVRVKLRIYWAWDNKDVFFGPVPDPFKEEVREPIPVGYSFLFDVTGRDKDNYETNGPGGDGHGIVWLPSDQQTMVLKASFGPWQQKYTATKPGKFVLCARWDDVYSNCVGFTVVACSAAVPPYLCN